MKIINLLSSCVSILMFFSLFSFAHASAWDTYKQRFLDDSGAIIDTGNNNMSHSEGQSYGMLFSLFYNDKESFDKIFRWTEKNLYNNETKLHNWAYKRNESNPVADKNNATDGDLMIAWALIEAGKKWNVREYTKTGEKIAFAVMKGNVISFNDGYVILPGLETFRHDNYVIVNPSYYIYPALNGIGRYTYQKKWNEIADYGKKLLNNLQGQKIKIAPDWLMLKLGGESKPADKWPTRSSYDAIRVPLYLYWDDPDCKELEVWRHYFSGYTDASNPAYIDVVSGQVADYPMSTGLKAVRNLVLGKLNSEPNLTSNDDYYNSSLAILAYIASQRPF